MKTFSIINEKGGVGKSSVALNLAYGLSQKGNRVLLIDLDPQHNVSSKLIKREEEIDCSRLQKFKTKIERMDDISFSRSIQLLGDFLKYVDDEEQFVDLSMVLKDPNRIHEAICKTRYANLDLIPATHKLSITDYELKNMRYSEKQLRLALSKVKEFYDVVIIDNSPFESALTYNSIDACPYKGDYVIIPTKIDYESWEGMYHTLHTLLNAQTSPYSDLDFDVMILPTMTAHTKATKIGVETLKKLFPQFVFDQTIRFQSSPVEKTSFDNEILLASQQSQIKKTGVYHDYQAFIEEFTDKCM